MPGAAVQADFLRAGRGLAAGGGQPGAKLRGLGFPALPRLHLPVSAAIAVTQGVLRGTRLKYHLYTVALVTQSQMHRYSELRGYGDHAMNPTHHHN